MTELVRKTSSNVGHSAPMAIPGGGGSRAMEVGSWRSNGSAPTGSYDFRRSTPNTPPLEGYLKRRTPQHQPQGPKTERIDAQPGIVVFFNIPHDAKVGRADVTDPVMRFLRQENVKVDHHFWLPPHQPPTNLYCKDMDGEGLGGSFSLQAAVPSTVSADELRVGVIVHCPTWFNAETGITALRLAQFTHPHTVQALEAPKEVRHSTLVLKNLPFQMKHETLMEELTRMACRPSYIRYYHGDRSMFKGIAFVKYANHDDAEVGRFQIDQLAMQGRKVRVEFKHKQGVRPDSHGRGISLEAAAANQDARSPTESPAIKAAASPQVIYTSPDDDAEPDEDEKALDRRIKEFLRTDDTSLMISRNIPGYIHIRRVCHRNHVRWDHQKECTMVKKVASTPSWSGARTPQMTSLKSATSTPSHSALTPASQPLNTSFGSNRKYMAPRHHESVYHCKGPSHDGEGAWSAGRGRPVPGGASPSPATSPSASPQTASPKTASSPKGVAVN